MRANEAPRMDQRIEWPGHVQASVREGIGEEKKGPGDNLGLDDIIATVLEGARRTLDATACSVWLVEHSTGDLVCKHSTDPKGTPIHGWRLAPGEGIAGWAVANKQGTIVADARADTRHAQEADKLTGLESRSILAVPMVTRQAVVGVIEAIDSKPNQFTSDDLHLMEALASTAAIAIENAQSYALRRQSEVYRERHRLARELHDSVVQDLYGIQLAAKTSLVLLEHKNVGSEVLDPLQQVVTLVQQILVNLRESIFDLSTESWTGRDLSAALRDHCAILRKLYCLDIQLSIDSEPELLPEQELTLYNVAREALWNVVRHACASSVEVRLGQEGDALVLRIADNGIGFRPNDIDVDEAQGIKDMRWCAEALGGVFLLESTPGRGTVVSVRMPYPCTGS